MKPVYTILLLLLLRHHYHSYGQDSIPAQNKITLNGYVKDLQTLAFDQDFKNVTSGNLLHNRINVKWKPSGTVTAAAEFRNRIFWGENVSETPRPGNAPGNENEVLDMSKIWVEKKNLLVHTNIERLWLEYRKSKWNIRLGRQRINWGITTTWNPNDIFNTYNFLDFDYEERPGSDAIKAQYLFNDFSNIEIAASPSAKNDRTVAAAKYFLNKGGYDMQWLAGVFHGKLTTGVGWAGSIGNAGFKGEGQLFFKGKDSATYFNGAIESDYVFNNGWYIDISLLYNSTGLKSAVSDWSKIDFTPSALEIMPARWNIILGSAKEFTPLFSGRMSVVYSPGVNLVILLPSFSYSLAENFTIDMVWQSFFTELNNRFGAVNHLCFFRMKWNF